VHPLIRPLIPSRVRGSGSLALLGTLLAQAAVAWLIATRPPPPEPVRGLSAAVVVEPPLGGQPRALGARDAVPADSRMQLTFEPGGPSWTAVLWFDGDHVTPLYPDPLRGQQGWTEATPYAVPGPGRWLRLTPSTAESGEFLAVVSALRPDPQITAVLADPRPGEVRALRRRLEEAAGARVTGLGAVERFLPTPDGRAVAAPWRAVVGRGALVLGWQITVESVAWPHPSMSSSSVPESPERSSPSAS
jgi:hypothetical protein